ncbi:MAG: glycosyltransferase [Bacteroidetes bacterium HGW-Bacteroidetes-22]|nr:MAG: glycosyltransferase [Bacteroidetes bacterium HGW-Bacteroidetes-22]
MDLSIVIPLYNEAESLPELTAGIDRVCQSMQISFEIVMVDDGSTDGSWQVVNQLSATYPVIHGIKFRRNYGKSAALNVGFGATKGKVVITMDADLQDSPDEIPELYEMVAVQRYDIVSGWKKKRLDNRLTKNIPSKLYNLAVRCVSKIKLHDMNCGLKAYRSEVVKSIEVYGEMHRYIPVIAKWAGFTNITEKVVQHRKRQYGTTKFGMERFMNGFLDLISISFVGRFGKKPMHFFGSIGTLMFIGGFLAAAWVGAQKLILLYHGVLAPKVTDSPYFYISLTAMLLGSQMFLAGFLGELISRNSSERNHYLIEGEF